MITPHRIRVGVTLDGQRVPRWKRDVLAALAREASVAAVLFPDPERGPREGALLRLYRALDRRVFADEHDPLELVDASELIAGLPAGAPADPLDVLLALGAEDVPGLPEPRLGVWAYRFGLRRERRDDLAFLEDIRASRRASHVALVRRGDGAVLACSTVRTDLVSLQRVRGAALLRARHLAGRALRDLRAGAEPPPPQPVPAPTSAPGHAVTLARMAARIAGHRVRNALWHEQWLFVVRRPEPGPPPLDFAGARLKCPPRGRDWADPFPFRSQGRSWVFFEEVPWNVGRGHISVGELDGVGGLHDVRPVLATPHHLSYPFVFTHEDETYLLPESRTSAATQLYRAVRFPDDWEPVCVLTDAPLYDPTLLRRDGRWWLFGTIAEPGESQDDELHLFWADALSGPWQVHPRNPIVSDVRGARPAGPLIADGTRLLRPAQDCSGRYGRAVVFKEVLELSDSDYREVEVARLEPAWLARNLATHHYATDERWAAIDALRRRRRW